jgi:hypothetical protein
VHVQQTAGFWGTWNSLFGHLYTPQIGYDPWFFEGLATHYEALALAYKNGIESKKLELWGSRNRIRNVTSLHVFDMLRKYLIKVK